MSLTFQFPEYKSKYSFKRGLGPTKLISPLIIFINVGISSMDVALNHLPKTVNLLSSSRRLPFLSFITHSSKLY